MNGFYNFYVVSDFFDTPQDHIMQLPIIKQIVKTMDYYRDLRLFWHFVDFFVAVALLIMVIYIIFKMRRLNHHVLEQQEELADLIRSLTKTAKDTDRVYRQIEHVNNGTPNTVI